MAPDTTAGPPATKDNTLRQGIAIVVAILFGLMLIAANHAGWIATTILDRDVFVATLEPLPKDPAVAQALAQEVATGIIDSFEVQDTIAESLPPDLSFIAPPLTDGIEGLVTDIVANIITSDPFTEVWRFTLEASHKAATAYVGLFDGDILTTDEGKAILDFSDVGAQVNEKLDEAGFDVLKGAEVDLKIELFELPDSGMIRAIVQIMTAVRWAVLILTFALLAVAYAVATNRRRISLWIGGATIIAMLISLIGMRYLRSAITGGIEDPVTEAGALAAWDIVFQRFVAQSWIVLLIGVIVAFVGWVTGDSDHARSARSAFVNASKRTGEDGSEPPEFALLVASKRRSIEWLALIVGAGVLLIAPPLAIGAVLLLVASIVVIVVAVEFISASASTSTTPHDSETTTAHPDAE
ncbi:MAG: hypothetical protein ABFR53_01230 [Actinomycetota bacterium]